MPLSDGYIDLSPGKLANVVTCLELRRKPAPRAGSASELALHRLGSGNVMEYRSIFLQIGAPYLWFSRLALPDEELARVLGDADVEAYVLRRDGTNAGLLELDFHVANECELCFFGVREDLQGNGYGGWLMDQAAALAWSRPIDRLWLHTCNLDHPRAMEFYMRAGFVPYKRQIEIADDPRIAGILPLDAAPHIPIIWPERKESAATRTLC